MRKIGILLGLLAVFAFVSCTNKTKADDAQKNAEAAAQQVDSINTVIAKASAKLDSIQQATYATPAEKQTALNEVQEEVNGAKSALENAQQKYEAAKQSFKDATGKEFTEVVNTAAKTATDAVTKTAAGQAVDAAAGAEKNDFAHINSCTCLVFFLANLKSVLEHGIDLRETLIDDESLVNR